MFYFSLAKEGLKLTWTLKFKIYAKLITILPLYLLYKQLAMGKESVLAQLVTDTPLPLESDRKVVFDNKDDEGVGH